MGGGHATENDLRKHDTRTPLATRAVKDQLFACSFGGSKRGLGLVSSAGIKDIYARDFRLVKARFFEALYISRLGIEGVLLVVEQAKHVLHALPVLGVSKNTPLLSALRTGSPVQPAFSIIAVATLIYIYI